MRGSVKGFWFIYGLYEVISRCLLPDFRFMFVSFKAVNWNI